MRPQVGQGIDKGGGKYCLQIMLARKQGHAKYKPIFVHIHMQQISTDLRDFCLLN